MCNPSTVRLWLTHSAPAHGQTEARLQRMTHRAESMAHISFTTTTTYLRTYLARISTPLKFPSLWSSHFSVLSHPILLKCVFQETSSHDACHSLLPDINTFFEKKFHHDHFDQGFEANFQISRMVPGLVKQGDRQVPGWETSFVLSTCSGASPSPVTWERCSPVCLSLHPAKLQDFLEIQKKSRPPSAVFYRIIGSCLDNTTGLSSLSIRYCCHSSDISFHT